MVKIRTIAGTELNMMQNMEFLIDEDAATTNNNEFQYKKEGNDIENYNYVELYIIFEIVSTDFGLTQSNYYSGYHGLVLAESSMPNNGQVEYSGRYIGDHISFNRSSPSFGLSNASNFQGTSTVTARFGDGRADVTLVQTSASGDVQTGTITIQDLVIMGNDFGSVAGTTRYESSAGFGPMGVIDDMSAVSMVGSFFGWDATADRGSQSGSGAPAEVAGNLHVEVPDGDNQRILNLIFVAK